MPSLSPSRARRRVSPSPANTANVAPPWAALLWSLTGGAVCHWLPGTAFAVTLPAIVVGVALLAPGRWRHSWPAAFAPFAVVLWLVLPMVHLLVQLMAPEPLVALALAVVVGTTTARLVSVPLAAIATQPRLRGLLWAFAAIALLASVVVARGLGWRCGSLWP